MVRRNAKEDNSNVIFLGGGFMLVVSLRNLYTVNVVIIVAQTVTVLSESKRYRL